MARANTERRIPSGTPRHALHGLSLPRSVLNALHKRGIYCCPGVSLEHQHFANRYVLRGVESGGAVSDVGRACAFFAPNGNSLPWLQRIDAIGVNGRHAVYLAEILVRVDFLRIGRTCEVAVSLHTLSCLPGHTRPQILSNLIFRGRDGALPVDLWKGEHRSLRGDIAPIFYSRAGEILILPKQFESAIRKVTACACCIGCSHSHTGLPPDAVWERT